MVKWKDLKEFIEKAKRDCEIEEFFYENFPYVSDYKKYSSYYKSGMTKEEMEMKILENDYLNGEEPNV